MKRNRSRLYPAISLREAVDRVGKLYEKEGRAAVSRGEALKGLGYSGANGSSLAAISAARKYGLVAKNMGAYRVTDLAERILNPSSQEVRAKSLQEAVRRPSVFAELLGCGQSQTDDELRAYLSTVGYSPTALPKVISSFRSSVDFVAESPGSSRVGASLNVKALGADPYRVSIMDKRIEVRGILTNSRSVDLLISVLEAAKVLLPAASDSEDGQAEK